MKVMCDSLSTVWIDKLHKSIFSAGAISVILCSKYVEDNNVKLNATVIPEVGEIYQRGTRFRYSSLIRYARAGKNEFELAVVIKN
jgi:hypothetical protein